METALLKCLGNQQMRYEENNQVYLFTPKLSPPKTVSRRSIYKNALAEYENTMLDSSSLNLFDADKNMTRTASNSFFYHARLSATAKTHGTSDLSLVTSRNVR